MMNPIERIGWWRLLALVGAVVFVGLGVQMVLRPDAEWAQVFVAASRDLARGSDFYGPSTLYLYPPFGALVGLAFAPLPEWAIRLVFYGVNVAALAALAVASWKIAGGGRLEVPSRASRAEWTILALGAIVAMPFAWNTILHQQADLVIDALVGLGMLAALRGRSVLAGVLIGLGAAFKGPPLLFAIYFLWRRDFVAALALFATAIGVNLLPDLVSRAPEGVWVGLWLKRWVLPATGADTALGSWGTALIYNQSFAGTIQRLANTELVRQGTDIVVAAKAELVATRPLKLFTYGLMGALALATLAASLVGGRRRPAGDAGAAREAYAIELAIVPPMMLLFSPMSGLAHFPIVAPLACLLARRAVALRDPAATVAVALALLAALAVNKDLVGHLVYDTVLWAGAATFAALVLWLGGLAVLARGPSAPRADD